MHSSGLSETALDTVLGILGSCSAIEKAITGGKGAADLIDMFRKYFPSKSGGTDTTDYSKLADYLDSLRKVGG
jgi:hypothetical protein